MVGGTAAAADMVLTDPPYGVAYTGGSTIKNEKIKSNGKKQIKNDSLDYKNLYSFLYDVFSNLKLPVSVIIAVYKHIAASCVISQLFFLK